MLLTSLQLSAQLSDSSLRVVRVQGTVNFRDAGGYQTTDGRIVSWGRVYRSTELSRLSAADLDTLDKRHIHTIIDFRGKGEAAMAPDKINPGTRYTSCPAGSDNITDLKKLVEQFRQGGFLEKLYGDSSVQYFGDRYRPLFQQLLSLPDSAALLFHCTAGRDRTGMAAALFLYALGVPQQTIEADYVASNVYLAPMEGRMYSALSKGFGLNPDSVKQQMTLRPELIRIFFAAISKRYGSVDLFLKSELGIGEPEIKLLRAKYTHV